MPILKARIPGIGRPLRVLIDSGAAISLISEALAELIDKKFEGHSEDDVRVRVANGSRVSLSRTFNIPLDFEGQVTDPVLLSALPNLPFDVLIGNPTLKRWKVDLSWVDLSWATKTFSFQPTKGSERYTTKWTSFHGQHWRGQPRYDVLRP